MDATPSVMRRGDRFSAVSALRISTECPQFSSKTRLYLLKALFELCLYPPFHPEVSPLVRSHAGIRSFVCCVKGGWFVPPSQIFDHVPQHESAMLATDVNENHRESVAEFVSCCSKVCTHFP